MGTRQFDLSWMGPSPCDDCRLRARCAVEMLACDSFRLYVELRRWETAPREPNAERFRLIFQPRHYDERELMRLRELKRLSRLAHGIKPRRQSRMSLEAAAIC